MKTFYILAFLAAVAVIDTEAINKKSFSQTGDDATRKLNPIIEKTSVVKRATKSKSQCQCGIRPPSFGIVGGQRTTARDFPWQAALKDSSGGHVCGGSIISESWVLTAAHCPAYTGYKIIVGSSNSRRSRNRQIRDVVEVIGHNSYSSGPNDIKVIRVDRPFEYNDYVAPVCLPFNLEHLTLADEQAEFAGWGRFLRRSRIASPILYKLHPRILSNEECQGYGEHPEIIESQICAEGQRPTGVCHGDSGGPLVYEARPNQFAVVGLVSYGPSDCYKVDVYTRVTSFLDWIIQETGVNDFCTPF